MIYKIENMKVDTINFKIMVDGSYVAVEPKVFDLIIYLIIHRDRVVTRQELFDHIWVGRVVADDSLACYIKKARKVLCDDGKQQRIIKTYHGRGFQFIADTDELKLHHDEVLPPNGDVNNEIDNIIHIKGDMDTNTLPALESFKGNAYREPISKPFELPDKPSLAIMDFDTIGVNDDASPFAYGLATDINSTLSRLPHLFITARASASIVSKLNLTPSEVARRLGVHYLVYGQAQYQAKRIKVTLSVVDAVNNTEIWSEHFNRSFDDLFQVQRDIVNAIVMAIDSAIEQAEIERSFLIPTEDLSAWENYHRGIWHINKTTAKDQEKTQYFLHKAISLDSRFSRAYAGLSYSHMSIKLLDISTEKGDDFEKAYDYATRSIDYCKFESMGYMSLGRVSFFSHEPERALKYLDHGLYLNPNYSYCHAIKGMASAHAGCTTQALYHLDVAERLSPFDSLLFAMKMAQATSLIRQKKFEEAAQISLLASSHPNAFFSTYSITAVCLQLIGNINEARKYVKKALQINPDYSVETYLQCLPFSEESTKLLISNAMQEAGMPLTNKKLMKQKYLYKS